MAIPDSGAANAAAKFYGLSQGQVSSFTSSPDGSIVSLLFDDFRAPPTVPSKTAPVPARTFTLVASAEAAGRSINFEIRGASLNAAGAKVRLRVADWQIELEPEAESFSLQAQALAEAETPVEISLELPNDNAAAGSDGGMLVIDTIDVCLPHCSSPGERD